MQCQCVCPMHRVPALVPGYHEVHEHLIGEAWRPALPLAQVNVEEGLPQRLGVIRDQEGLAS